MLSTVVLPAPFGPIIEKTWPASTSRLTFVTAWTPPNDFETSRISTCALIGRRGATPPFRNLPPGPVAAAKPPLEHDSVRPSSSQLRAPALPAQSSWGRSRRGPSRPSPNSRQPPFAASIVLDVTVALPLPHAGESQVELLDVLVLADRPRVAVEDHAPALHDVAVLREPERHRGILLGEQDGDPFLAVHAAHDLEDLVHQHRREPHRGLVEQHEPGPGHERAPDRHHLLLTARDVAGPHL